MKRIEIVVSPAGETRLETTGFSGPECLAASRFLEAALGKRSSERFTAAYYQQAPATESQQIEQEPC